MLAAARMGEQGLELYAKNLEFLSEEAKIQHLQRPAPATANRAMLDLRTMVLRDYSAPEAKGVPTIVDAPYAAHSAVIARLLQGSTTVTEFDGISRSVGRSVFARRHVMGHLACAVPMRRAPYSHTLADTSSCRLVRR